METYAQIKQSLKKLRLATIANTIEERTTEAIEHKLSYIDYLLLLQDEIDARSQKKDEVQFRIRNCQAIRLCRIAVISDNSGTSRNRPHSTASYKTGASSPSGFCVAKYPAHTQYKALPGFYPKSLN